MDGTLSSSSPAISEPRAGEEVSWSSSDGSTYDTEDDLIDQLVHGDDPKKKVSILPPDFELSNKDTLPPQTTTTTTTTTTGRPKSRLLRPFSRTNPKELSKQMEEDTKLLVKQPQQSRHRKGKRNPNISDNKRRCALEGVDVYDDIEVSSNKEDLSTVCFLSKEETAEVFTKQLVPLDIFLKSNTHHTAGGNNIADELSAISSSIKGSTSMDNGSDSSVRVTHGRPRHNLMEKISDSDERVMNAVLGISNHFATKNTQMIDYVQRSISSQAEEDEYLLETVSISCQQTVSSLESSLTWDSQQDGNNNNHEEGNGSEDAVRGPLKTTKIQPLLPPPLPLTAAPGRNTEQVDATMDERIQKLKAKIKSMQQTSGLENNVDEESRAGLASNLRRRHSKEIDDSGEMLDNSVLTPSTGSPTNKSNSPKRDDIDESTYEASEATPSEITFSPLDLDGLSTQASSFHGHPSTTTCTESEHRRTLERLAEVSCDSADEELSMDEPTAAKVPIIIPVDDLEDVSLMDTPSRYDIEGGRINGSEKTTGHGGQEFLQKTQAKAKVLLENLFRMIETKRNEFQAKSRSDKIVTVTISAGLFILFILLMSLIAN